MCLELYRPWYISFSSNSNKAALSAASQPDNKIVDFPMGSTSISSIVFPANSSVACWLFGTLPYIIKNLKFSCGKTVDLILSNSRIKCALKI